MVGHSSRIAERLVEDGHLRVVLDSLRSENKSQRKASFFVIKNLAKAGEPFAEQVMSDSGAVSGILSALTDADAAVNESAVWALGYIVKQSPALATIAVDAGCLPLVSRLLAEKDEPPLRRISISLLGDIAKHSENLADQVLQQNLMPKLLDFSRHDDVGTRKQATACLCQLIRHSASQANEVSGMPNFYTLVNCLLNDSNKTVRRNTCIILRDLCEKDATSATRVVDAGLVPSLNTLITNIGSDEEKVPAVTCLGHIACHSGPLAKSLIVSCVIPTICKDLISSTSENLRLAIIFCVTQVGKHGNEYCRPLNDQAVLTRLLALQIHTNSTQAMRYSSKDAFRTIVENTNDFAVLEPLIKDVEDENLNVVLMQLSNLLQENMEAKKHFVQSGSLQRVSAMYAKCNEETRSSIMAIQSCFPKEILEFFDTFHE